LWLPYGLASLVSVLCLLVGGLAVLGNDGEIYDNSFSTVLRTTGNWAVDGLAGDDMSGGQSLSRNIGRMRVRLGISRESESAALHDRGGRSRTFVIVR
jgi:hypothetical protein